MSGVCESNGRVIGSVLTGATTRRVLFQVAEDAEEYVREGMLVAICAWRGRRMLVARVDSIRVESDIGQPGSLWDSLRASSPQSLLEVEKLAPPTIIAEASILGVAGRGLNPPPRPPLPNDLVVELPGDPRSVFGVRRDEPGVIWYGSILGYEELPLPLDIEAVTMHIGVFGETGSGKSYGVGYLFELLSRIPLGNGIYGSLPVIVIDANGDYLDYYETYVESGKAAGFKRVYRLVTPRSRHRSRAYTKSLVISLDEFTPREVAEIIISYKTGGREMNELQVAALDRALSELVEEGYSVTELLTTSIGLLYERLEALSRGREAVIHHQTVRAVKAALDKFHREVYRQHGVIGEKPELDKRFIDEITSEPSLAIVDFSADGSPGLPLQVKQLIVAYIARLLYEKFTEYKVSGRDRYLVFAIEEAQNYAPNLRNYPVGVSIARDYLALLATQGRKFGIALLLVSQRPAFVDPVVVSMLNTLFIHRLAPDDVAYVSRAVGGLPKSLESRLTTLPRGVALVAGQMNMVGHPVLVKVGKRSVPHRMGSTGIVRHLREASEAHR